jgi:hypothetical protein
MRQEWTGIWVHKSVWEAKHPQDDILTRKENIAVYPDRSEENLVFVSNTTQETPLVFANARNATISSNGYVATSTATSDCEITSEQIIQDTTLRGVRFSFDTSQLSVTDTIYAGFLSGDSVVTSTNVLMAAFVYDGSNLTLAGIGNFINGDQDAPVNTHTYTSGTQICVAINSTGLIKVFIGGVEYSFTTSAPVVDDIVRFSTYFANVASAGPQVTISTAASIYPTVTDYTIGATPSMPPSNLDS